jgi:hypothetical protein
MPAPKTARRAGPVPKTAPHCPAPPLGGPWRQAVPKTAPHRHVGAGGAALFVQSMMSN